MVVDGFFLTVYSEKRKILLSDKIHKTHDRQPCCKRKNSLARREKIWRAKAPRISKLGANILWSLCNLQKYKPTQVIINTLPIRNVLLNEVKYFFWFWVHYNLRKTQKMCFLYPLDHGIPYLFYLISIVESFSTAFSSKVNIFQRTASSYVVISFFVQPTQVRVETSKTNLKGFHHLIFSLLHGTNYYFIEPQSYNAEKKIITKLFYCIRKW